MIHVLIADDDDHIRELLRHHLQLEGYVIYEAKDGEEASLILLNSQIHIAVIDIMMRIKMVISRMLNLCDRILYMEDGRFVKEMNQIDEGTLK
jgi:CheY-like chemotaxis protein